MLNLKSLFTKILTEGIFKTGGTLTGTLKTSFQQSQVVGYKYISSTTVANLMTTLSGLYMFGQTYINTAFTGGGITVPTGYYNFISFGNRVMLFQTVGERVYVVNSGFVSQIQPINYQKGSITQGTATYYKLYGTSGTNYYWYRQGNKVIVNLRVQCVSSNSTMVQFASGLPKSIYQGDLYFPLSCETAGTYKPIWGAISNAGGLYAQLGTANQIYYGSFSYITNDF